MLKKILYVLLSIIVVGYIFAAYVLSSLILEPQGSMDKTKAKIQSSWGTTYEAMVAPLPAPDTFSVAGDEGVRISGLYFPMADTASCAIIFAHGWSSNWAGMLKYASIFEDCGCHLVLYDHRGHGESGQAYATAGIREKEDLLRVTSWVENTFDLQSSQIGWVGASWGAATVLQAGAADEDVAFIIADAPFQDWYTAIFERGIKRFGSGVNLLSFGVMTAVNWRAGIDYHEASPLLAADKIREPVLLIHSKSDSKTNSQQSVHIAEKLNPTTSVFHHLDWGSDHNRDVLDHREQFIGLVASFLREKAGEFPSCWQED